MIMKMQAKHSLMLPNKMIDSQELLVILCCCALKKLIAKLSPHTDPFSLNKKSPTFSKSTASLKVNGSSALSFRSRTRFLIIPVNMEISLQSKALIFIRQQKTSTRHIIVTNINLKHLTYARTLYERINILGSIWKYLHCFCEQNC